MRVFVTGASGWIGSHTVPELISAGHQVSAIARSDESAAKLRAAGVVVIRGSLDDLSVIRDAAAASDGVLHLAFDHAQAFSGHFDVAAQADRNVIETIATVLENSDRPLIIASGALGVKPGQLATEYDAVDPSRHQGGLSMRLDNANYTLGLKARGIRSGVMRLAPTVHGDGDYGFLHRVVTFAREKGVSPYIGDGANRWPAIDVRDAAKLFRLGLEKVPAGSVMHAVADEGVAWRDIAAVVGKHLNVPVKSISQEEAPAHFTWLAHFIAMDAPTSNAWTRETLGWEPSEPGLLADLDKGHYFTAAPTQKY